MPRTCWPIWRAGGDARAMRAPACSTRNAASVLAPQLAGRRLADVFLDLDPQHIGHIIMKPGQIVAEALGDVAGQQLGSRVLDRQEHAVITGKEPLSVLVADANVL